MYLSCLLIDTGNDPDRPRPGRVWLRNRQHVHQRLCMAFPSASKKSDDPDFLKPFNPEDFAAPDGCGPKQVHVARGPDAGFLFCVDPQQGGRVVIVIQSAVKPDWNYAFRNAAHLLAAAPEMKEVDPHFVKGQSLRFRLRANPTRKIETKTGADGIRRNGKRVELRTEQEQLNWLKRKGPDGGFEIVPVRTAPQVADVRVSDEGTIGGFRSSPPVPGANGKRRLTFASVLFEGKLRVTDPVKFRATLEHGVGSAKAYGFGLLSIAPAE